MRNSIKMFLVITLLGVVVSNSDMVSDSIWPATQQVDSNIPLSGHFVQLPSKEANVKLVALRKHCGDMAGAVKGIETALANYDPEYSDLSYLELVDNAVGVLKYVGAILPECAGKHKDGWHVLLSTEGDLVIGLQGRAVTRYSEIVLQQEQDEADAAEEEAAEWKSVWDQMRTFSEASKIKQGRS